MTRIVALFGFLLAIAGLAGLCLADTKAGGRNDASPSSMQRTRPPLPSSPRSPRPKILPTS